MNTTYTVTNPPGAGVGPLVLVCVVAEGKISTVVHLIGELDIATAPLLIRIVEGQIAQEHLDLRLDLGELTFCDLRGVSTLALAQQCLRAVGGRLALLRADDHLKWLVSWCGMDDLLVIGGPGPDCGSEW